MVEPKLGQIWREKDTKTLWQINGLSTGYFSLMSVGSSVYSHPRFGMPLNILHSRYEFFVDLLAAQTPKIVSGETWYLKDEGWLLQSVEVLSILGGVVTYRYKLSGEAWQFGAMAESEFLAGWTKDRPIIPQYTVEWREAVEGEKIIQPTGAIRTVNNNSTVPLWVIVNGGDSN